VSQDPPRDPEPNDELPLEEALQSELDEALFALDELVHEDPEEALAMFDTLPERVQARDDFQLLLARAHHQLGQMDAALDILRALETRVFELGDLHHQLGDVLEDLGRTDEANKHFLKVRALDERQYLALPESQRASFEDVVSRCLSRVAAAMAGKPGSEKCSLRVLVIPSEEDVLAGVDPRRLARWDGEIPQLSAYAANLFAECYDEYDGSWMVQVLAMIVEDVGDEMGLLEEALDLLGLSQPR